MKCAETFCEIAPTSLFSPYLVSRITLSRYRRIKEGKHKVEAAQTFAGVSARFRQAWAEGQHPSAPKAERGVSMTPRSVQASSAKVSPGLFL